jgi:peroxiredoxin
MTASSIAQLLEAFTEQCRTMDAPLPDRLRTFAGDVRRLSPEFADIVERMIERLNRSEAGQLAPSPGEPMPSFVLPDQDGHLVGLDRLLASGQVVVSFHRGHWCPYCRLNADALARIAPEVGEAGGQVVVITPELRAFTNELRSDAKATFPILTDIDNGYALELGLAIKILDEKRQAMIAAGWDISPYVGNSSWTLPIPGTFVVGRDGRVKARFVDPDYRRRMDVVDILAALGN